MVLRTEEGQVGRREALGGKRVGSVTNQRVIVRPPKMRPKKMGQGNESPVKVRPVEVS